MSDFDRVNKLNDGGPLLSETVRIRSILGGMFALCQNR
jgi:hypothetical protein